MKGITMCAFLILLLAVGAFLHQEWLEKNVELKFDKTGYLCEVNSGEIEKYFANEHNDGALLKYDNAHTIIEIKTDNYGSGVEIYFNEKFMGKLNHCDALRVRHASIKNEVLFFNGNIYVR